MTQPVGEQGKNSRTPTQLGQTIRLGLVIGLAIGAGRIGGEIGGRIGGEVGHWIGVILGAALVAIVVSIILQVLHWFFAKETPHENDAEKKLKNKETEKN